MKRRIKLLGLLLFASLVCLQAQTPYFYYYNGEKQYLELNTKHVFVSIANENNTKLFISDDAKHEPFRIDIMNNE